MKTSFDFASIEEIAHDIEVMESMINSEPLDEDTLDELQYEVDALRARLKQFS